MSSSRPTAHRAPRYRSTSTPSIVIGVLASGGARESRQMRILRPCGQRKTIMVQLAIMKGGTCVEAVAWPASDIIYPDG